MGQMYVVLSSFLSYSFHNHLVISTGTYFVEFYTPDKNVKNVYTLTVEIVGEKGKKTGKHLLVTKRTTPETEVRGYVIY